MNVLCTDKTGTLTEGDDRARRRHRSVTKGAFVNVLSMCTHVERDGAVCPLTDAIISELSTYYEAKGKRRERAAPATRSATLGTASTTPPSLHAADVGISVDQAVDVARESADIILLKRDLDVLRTGVVDGRRTFANTLKYISIRRARTSEMVSMAIAAPLLPFLRTYRLIQCALDHRTESSPTHRYRQTAASPQSSALCR